MKVRAYHSSDWQAICRIWNRAKLDEFRGLVDPALILPLEEDAGMREFFHANHIYVGEVQEQIVGFGGHRGRLIGWLFVDPDYRRRGYGGRLLGEILNHVGPVAYLNVAAANEPALSLYRQFGFRLNRRYQGNYRGIKIPALRMVRNVNGEVGQREDPQR